MKTEHRNYGFVEPVITDDHYIFGASVLPRNVLQASGQWDDYLPVYEKQSTDLYDTYGCTIFGTQNAVEIFIKKILGLEKNYAERFTYILSNTQPPGNDPHVIAETIRKTGMIDNDILPMTETFEEFVQPNPMDENFIVKGKEWLAAFDFKHEWVFTGELAKDQRLALMKQVLQYSPLCISVTAWFEEDGVYVDNGLPNSHWCVCYGWNEQGWKIFDSYDSSLKTVSFDHHIKYCKRYSLIPASAVPAKKKSWLDILISFFRK